MIAALFVHPGGVYFGMPGVDPWDEARDARTYAGPHPVVAHPPCQRWGKYAEGSTHPAPNGVWKRFRVGDDGGCFAAALAAVRKYGGVLEHPASSKAWAAHGLSHPVATGGWTLCDHHGGFTCCVYQGKYGHRAPKPTWLYAVGTARPELRWGRVRSTLPATAAEKARGRATKAGMSRNVLERMSHNQRIATPVEFRDLLISLALSADQVLS